MTDNTIIAIYYSKQKKVLTMDLKSMINFTFGFSALLYALLSDHYVARGLRRKLISVGHQVCYEIRNLDFKIVQF